MFVKGSFPLPYSALECDEDWTKLCSQLTSSNSTAFRNVLLYLRQMGAKSAVVENDYLDRDFTAEFSAFYAHVFKRHRKICKRVLFFVSH